MEFKSLEQSKSAESPCDPVELGKCHRASQGKLHCQRKYFQPRANPKQNQSMQILLACSCPVVGGSGGASGEGGATTFAGPLVSIICGSSFKCRKMMALN